jgi:hypothetical protein
MARYHGKKGRLYLSTSAASVATPVGSISHWSLDLSTDTAETTSFGDTNKTYVQGLPNAQISFDGFFDDTQLATIYSASISASGCNAYVYFSTDALLYFYFPAWLSISLDTPVGDAVKISGTLTANGPIGSKTS